MSTALVTGGAGFLGSHLCRSLLNDGYRVICADSFYTGSRRNIAELEADSQFDLLVHDIISPLYVEVDEIYNLACPASPIHYQANAIRTVKANVIGTLNLLGLAKRTGARFFQASTSEIYGDPEVHPQPESYRGSVNPIGPRACYDEGKRCAETLCFDYHREHDVDVRVARIFNTYGPNMRPDDGRVVSTFIVQALQGQPLTLYGDGSQTRSFCYVSDLIDGFRRYMALDQPEPGPINLGNPGEFTIRELAQMVLEMTGSSSALVEGPLPKDDPTRRRPDISAAQEKLHWSPQVPLGRGLPATIEYFDRLLTDPRAATTGPVTMPLYAASRARA